MSARADDRVAAGRELGQGDKPLDLLLGASAFAPLVAAGIAAWLVPRELRPVFYDATRAWGALLVCFFAGVRRGLTFSERRGASFAEVATFLALFFLAAAGWLFGPVLLATLAVAGTADALAARQGQAPRYFTWLRPAQAAVAIAAVASAMLAAR